MAGYLARLQAHMLPTRRGAREVAVNWLLILAGLVVDSRRDGLISDHPRSTACAC